MGATWLGKKHMALYQLLQELEVDIFPQQMGDTAHYEPLSTSPPQLVTLPPNPDPSYRIKGGSSMLINKLAAHLSSEQIKMGAVVQRISEEGEQMKVITNNGTYLADQVVSTLPPYLLVKTVKFEDTLPEKLMEIAQATHTWMGESIKVGLRYKQPFWKEKNTSGTIFSNVGPIPEMYDHSNYESNYFALKGFFNGSYFSITMEERRDMVLKQLEKYFGKVVYEYEEYHEAVWRLEPYTFHTYDQHLLPHQNNGHPVFRKSFYNNKFWIAGAETAGAYPGYMEGAVQSANFIMENI